MHIDDETLDALGYACPEWDDVCERAHEERARHPQVFVRVGHETVPLHSEAAR